MRKGRKQITGKKKTARKKAARKKTANRKIGARRNRSGKKTGMSWIGRIWRLALLVAGVCLGLLVPWVAYLNHQVTTEFEGRKWDLPSRVYARALDLYPGVPISLKDLELELSVAGYRRKTNAGRPGLYSVSGNTMEIYRRWNPLKLPPFTPCRKKTARW
jgi:penicillin-binding protein 1B